jgi:molybdopterin converting factor small subunit
MDEQDGIREHIKIFVNQQQVRDLAVPLRGGDEVQIVCAFSGG